MRKCIILILCVSLFLTGCSWLDGEYHSVTPHTSDGTQQSDDVVTVATYTDLRDALVKMVSSGRQESTFYLTGFGLDMVDNYMKKSINHVFENSAIGAYAVDKIEYEGGIRGKLYAIAVDVSYVHGRQEIMRIKSVGKMDDAKALIRNALRNCEGSTVIKVSEYQVLNVEKFVQDYASNNPHICMELPSVTTSVYPEFGQERILEITFTYQTPRDSLREMQNAVSPIFAAAEMYVAGSEGELQKYEQLSSFLMERFDYKIESSITPVYSLVRYGVGDSKAFAMVYSIMCQNADLECQVVSGTKDGKAYYWNLIRCDGVDYHVDLLESEENGEFTPMIPEEMSGYVWDYSKFQ